MGRTPSNGGRVPHASETGVPAVRAIGPGPRSPQVSIAHFRSATPTESLFRIAVSACRCAIPTGETVRGGLERVRRSDKRHGEPPNVYTLFYEGPVLLASKKPRFRGPRRDGRAGIGAFRVVCLKNGQWLTESVELWLPAFVAFRRFPPLLMKRVRLI